jgi:hypothetical protein
LLAQYPTDGVDEVRFARAVWPHDGGDAWFEKETGSLRERLEAEKVYAL